MFDADRACVSLLHLLGVTLDEPRSGSVAGPPNTVIRLGDSSF